MTKEAIEVACLKENILGFDIYFEDKLIGFAMVRKFEKGSYFLWCYAIDYKYQNNNYGTLALKDFISFMKQNYNMSKMTTTYLFGNEQAKRLYKKLGFVETDIVDEDGEHEVNMALICWNNNI